MPTAPDEVLIFSTQTLTGLFTISAPCSAFDIQYKLPDQSYILRNDRFPSFESRFNTVYDPILAVAQHRVGIPEWDDSTEQVPDYAGDWVRENDKKFLMNLLGNYLDKRPDSSLRQLVDYFEHRHSYFLERMVIDDLLVELITTGQLTKLPSMHMAPAEMKDLERIANHWLKETAEDLR